MKIVQDLGRKEYRFYRQHIHRVAPATRELPSEFLRPLLARALEIHLPSIQEGP